MEHLKTVADDEKKIENSVTGTALIIGVSGQDGSYLAQQLASLNYRVIGTTTRYSNKRLVNLVDLRIAEKVEIQQLDLPNKNCLDDLIKKLHLRPCH